jgi:Cyclic nucleotide-binding domain.
VRLSQSRPQRLLRYWRAILIFFTAGLRKKFTVYVNMLKYCPMEGTNSESSSLYWRNAKVIAKGEAADYFAIIMSGKLLIKQDDRSLGYLETGDMIGYMSFLDLPGYSWESLSLTLAQKHTLSMSLESRRDFLPLLDLMISRTWTRRILN